MSMIDHGGHEQPFQGTWAATEMRTQRLWNRPMCKLNADFSADLLNMARRQLTEKWGRDVHQIRDADVFISFVDSLRRRPVAGPRKLWIGDNFRCPPEHAQGWVLLQEKIVTGKDLFPHLSRGHLSLGTIDGLLNEWGVHHLHLGVISPRNDFGFVVRTGPVLFARITDRDFYAINVCDHGFWERLNILESLHRNWPDSISSYRLNGVNGEPLTEKERRRLRSLNGHVATTVADGTVYTAIGGGVASSGISMEAVMCSDMLRSDVEQLQVAMQEQPEKFLPQLRTSGHAGQREIKAVLVGITCKAFQVSFPDFGFLSVITLKGGWFHGRQYRSDNR